MGKHHPKARGGKTLFFSQGLAQGARNPGSYPHHCGNTGQTAAVSGPKDGARGLCWTKSTRSPGVSREVEAGRIREVQDYIKRFMVGKWRSFGVGERRGAGHRGGPGPGVNAKSWEFKDKNHTKLEASLDP